MLDGVTNVATGNESVPGARFFSLTCPFQPLFHHSPIVFIPRPILSISMLSTAFMAHFNSPKFYTELKNNTLERFQKVVSVSFGISIAIFSLITSFGFLTFGGASDGLILNNYSTKDTLMSLSRIAVAVSLVFS